VSRILQHFLRRPRDVILFLNECIAHSAGTGKFTASAIKKAEEEYSHKRLHSLWTEWRIMFPNLKHVAQLLYGLRNHFPVSDITKDFLDARYQELAQGIEDTACDPNTRMLDSLYNPQGNFNSVRNTLLRNLHLVGLIGIKPGPTSSTNWVHDSRLSLSPGEVRPNSAIHIHPMFHRALGVRL
jgi:hypothetical protein